MAPPKPNSLGLFGATTCPSGTRADRLIGRPGSKAEDGNGQSTVIVSVPRVCVPLTPATLACTVMATWTGEGVGVGDGLPPPPPQDAVVRKSNAAPSKAADGAAVFNLLRRNSNPSNRIATSTASTQIAGQGRGRLSSRSKSKDKTPALFPKKR